MQQINSFQFTAKQLNILIHQKKIGKAARFFFMTSRLAHFSLLWRHKRVFWLLRDDSRSPLKSSLATGGVRGPWTFNPLFVHCDVTKRFLWRHNGHQRLQVACMQTAENLQKKSWIISLIFNFFIYVLLQKCYQEKIVKFINNCEV